MRAGWRIALGMVCTKCGREIEVWKDCAAPDEDDRTIHFRCVPCGWEVRGLSVNERIASGTLEKRAMRDGGVMYCGTIGDGAEHWKRVRG